MRLPINIIKKEIIKKGLDKYINEVGYAEYPKKYYVILKNGKKVSFGDVRYEDYLIHGDRQRRLRYRQRHRNDNINDPESPGYWAWHLLW